MKQLFDTRIPPILVLLTVLLTACGGGGGGQDGGKSPATTVADAQGRWEGRVDLGAGGQSASALVLPNGQIWLLLTTAGAGRRLVNGSLSQNGQQLSSTAQLYDLDTGNLSGDVTLTATATANTQLTVNTNEPTQVGNFSSTTHKSQNTPAVSVTGVWQDSLTFPSVQWTIAGDGGLSGYGTGCTYSGSVQSRADSAAVADVQLQEDCSGNITTWTGISLNGGTSNSLRFTMIKSDRTRAYVLELLK